MHGMNIIKLLRVVKSRMMTVEQLVGWNAVVWQCTDRNSVRYLFERASLVTMVNKKAK